MTRSVKTWAAPQDWKWGARMPQKPTSRRALVVSTAKAAITVARARVRGFIVLRVRQIGIRGNYLGGY